MDAAWYVYVLAILAGVLAGIINTLAGSGSLVTLPMLVFLGLPANEANATNRIGVLLQNIVGIAAFQRSGQFELSSSYWLVGASIPGALVGSWIASQLGKREMDLVIGVVMVIMLFVILFNPQKWLREKSEVRPGRPSIGILLLFFIIGGYGGFIQAGVGVFLLAAMVMGMGFSLVHANAIKLMIVLVLTVVAMAVFLYQDIFVYTEGQLLHWGLGILMAVGQSIGAWIAARFATSNKNANVWVRRLLITVVVISILEFFGILDRILVLVSLA